MLHSVRTIRRILVLGVLLGTGTSSALASQRVLNGHWFSPHRLVKWPFAVSDTSVQMGAGSLELLDSAGRSSFAWVAPQVSHQMAHQIGRSRWALAVGFEPEVRTPTATQGLGSRELESDTRLSGTLMLELLRTRKWVLSPFFSVDLGYRAGFSQIKIDRTRAFRAKFRQDRPHDRKKGLFRCRRYDVLRGRKLKYGESSLKSLRAFQDSARSVPQRGLRRFGRYRCAGF